MDVDSSLAGPASPAESSAQGAAAAAAAASAGPHATSVNRRYPIPPPAYKLFTADAWRAFEKRKDKQPATDEQTRANQPDDADAREDADDVVLTDEQLEAFEPPRVDWIEEDGGWQAFGQTHAVRPHVFTATDLGIPDFRPQGIDISPRDHLLLLLRSFIHTTLLLFKALSTGAPPTHEVNAKGLAHRTAQHVEHLANLAGTMTTMTNELRPIQARLSVETMLRTQLERRRAETEALRSKTQGLARRVLALKERAAGMAAEQEEAEPVSISAGQGRDEAQADSAKPNDALGTREGSALGDLEADGERMDQT